MLKIFNRFADIPFEDLAEVCSESIAEQGRRRFPYESECRQQVLAERELYDYYQLSFFHDRLNAVYAWYVDEKMVCILRTEPFEGGVLITGLETALSFRRKGYASDLICSVQSYLEEKGISVMYAHVSRKNTASLRMHDRCGFIKLSDYARLLDGSVDGNYVTLISCLNEKKTVDKCD